MKHHFEPDFEQDLDESPVTFVRMKATQREKALARAGRHIPRNGPQKKASYESSTAVQRWLKTQGYDESEETKQQSTFNPAFLASRRDAPWLLSSLTPLYDQRLIVDVLHEAHSGKEATVYCCAAHPSTGAEYLAAKIYRPRMFRSLRNDAVYRFSRVQRDEQGQAEHGNSRRGSAATRKTERGRAAQVNAWIDYEYQTQRLMYAHGADVPRPYAQVGNAVLMEYIGEAEHPAPRLGDVILEPEEAQEHFACILRNIELALTHGRIHGDLSEYNVLYWEGKVILIDFAQAADPYHNSDVYSLFARDIERVCQHFARYAIEADPATLAREMWSRHMGPVPTLM